MQKRTTLQAGPSAALLPSATPLAANGVSDDHSSCSYDASRRECCQLILGELTRLVSPNPLGGYERPVLRVGIDGVELLESWVRLGLNFDCRTLGKPISGPSAYERSAYNR